MPRALSCGSAFCHGRHKKPHGRLVMSPCFGVASADARRPRSWQTSQTGIKRALRSTGGSRTLKSGCFSSCAAEARLAGSFCRHCRTTSRKACAIRQYQLNCIVFHSTKTAAGSLSRIAAHQLQQSGEFPLLEILSGNSHTWENSRPSVGSCSCGGSPLVMLMTTFFSDSSSCGACREM